MGPVEFQNFLTVIPEVRVLCFSLCFGWIGRVFCRKRQRRSTSCPTQRVCFFLGRLIRVSVQAIVALAICALDCDSARPRTRHQIWSEASQVKVKPMRASAYSMGDRLNPSPSKCQQPPRLVQHAKAFPNSPAQGPRTAITTVQRMLHRER